MCALKVDERAYSAIVVPAILQKLPENIRLTITRGSDYLKWTMKEMLEAPQGELELREEHSIIPDINIDKEERKPRRDRRSSASALLAKREEKECAFCLGDHAHQE